MNVIGILFIFVTATSVATLLGGLLAMRYKQALVPIIGFSAGVLIATSFAHLLPEVFELMPEDGYSVRWIMTFVVISFLFFHILEKFALWHACREEDKHFHRHQKIGILGAMGLSLHSFFDGMIIGIAFQTNFQVGIVVATAVALHKFSDGLSLISIMALNQNSWKDSVVWLCISAFVPFLGALSTFAFTMSDAALALFLAAFSGLFLYIGASDLLPEAHRVNSSPMTMVATVAGIAFVLILTFIFHA
jgi:zinc transporter ZupT